MLLICPRFINAPGSPELTFKTSGFFHMWQNIKCKRSDSSVQPHSNHYATQTPEANHWIF